MKLEADMQIDDRETLTGGLLIKMGIAYPNEESEKIIN